MSDASSYFLTEVQLRARFDERVKEFVFSGYKPQENPAALVLLGGQPAAGKSQSMAATVRPRRHPGPPHPCLELLQSASAPLLPPLWQ
ncbi:hypothetical protein [Streptomyces sp. NPDC056543]|uniref:hypothetical protein n=1 Tax=unclassified Streptomyces TaxID=2593676 RepID=UPI0036807FB6